MPSEKKHFQHYIEQHSPIIAATYADKPNIENHTKKLIKEKRADYIEKEARRQADDATIDPFIVLRRGRPATSNEIPMETWENYFQEIFNYYHSNTTCEASTRETEDYPNTITREEIIHTIQLQKTRKQLDPMASIPNT